MHPPVDIGVLRAVEPGDRVDDDLGLLAGSCVVEVHQRLAPNSLAENREILPDPGDVQGRSR
jgi:hypothetical protein